MKNIYFSMQKEKGSIQTEYSAYRYIISRLTRLGGKISFNQFVSGINNIQHCGVLYNTMYEYVILIYFENLCLLILHARNDILQSEASVILHYRISNIDFPPLKAKIYIYTFSPYSFQPIDVINYILI